MVDGAGFVSDDSIYAFAVSHSLLLNVWNKSHYEIMLIRKTNYYDDKGIEDPLNDKNIETLWMVHYVADTPNAFLKRRTIQNHSLNSKV